MSPRPRTPVPAPPPKPVPPGTCVYCADPPDVVITWVRYGDQDWVCESHWEFLRERCPRVFTARPTSAAMIRRW
jgi:hypothetical protein